MSSRTDYGKGDRARSVDRKKWDAGWDRVFGKNRCKHPGCKSHVSHSCEECGYQGDK